MKNKNKILSISIWTLFIVLAAFWLYTAQFKPNLQSGNNISFNQTKKITSKSAIPSAASSKNKVASAKLSEEVLPSQGVVLPVSWGNLGAQLVKLGVIDQNKFTALYQRRGTFSPEYKQLLLGNNSGQLKITKSNSGYLLNLFWAFGLANANPILGEMTKAVNGQTQNLASTGGWTIAKGNAMQYYGRYKLINLTTQQQSLVDTVSRGIYRPCCGNSAHFPGCNHGMAMLGFLELMASQGASEQAMWNAALTVNSYWFPSTYLTIATYMNNNGVDWKNVSPQEVLGRNYSSAQGYARLAAQTVTPRQAGSSGVSCGVSAGGATTPQSPSPAVPQQQSSGCGI